MPLWHNGKKTRGTNERKEGRRKGRYLVCKQSLVPGGQCSLGGTFAMDSRGRRTTAAFWVILVYLGLLFWNGRLQIYQIHSTNHVRSNRRLLNNVHNSPLMWQSSQCSRDCSSRYHHCWTCRWLGSLCLFQDRERSAQKVQLRDRGVAIEDQVSCWQREQM